MKLFSILMYFYSIIFNCSLQGREFFKSKIFIEATQLSQEAIARIEELDGTAIAIHHTKLSLRALTRPYLFHDRILPRSPAPVSYRERLFYSDPRNRGYLVEENWRKCAEMDLKFEERYIRDNVTPLPEPPVPFKTFLLKKFKEQESLKKSEKSGNIENVNNSNSNSNSF